jgi:hypothetical protein
MIEDKTEDARKDIDANFVPDARVCGSHFTTDTLTYSIATLHNPVSD